MQASAFVLVQTWQKLLSHLTVRAIRYTIRSMRFLHCEQHITANPATPAKGKMPSMLGCFATQREATEAGKTQAEPAAISAADAPILASDARHDQSTSSKARHVETSPDVDLNITPAVCCLSNSASTQSSRWGTAGVMLRRKKSLRNHPGQALRWDLRQALFGPQGTHSPGLGLQSPGLGEGTARRGGAAGAAPRAAQSFEV